MAAIKTGNYDKLIDEAVKEGIEKGNTPEEKKEFAFNILLVKFGVEILKLVPGRVSTEVDAKYSFDTNSTLRNAFRLIQLYKDRGIDKDRVLIKIAATWEGINAAEILEKEHQIHCNLTLIFSLVQAVACAEAKVTLISPFVGRILDWYVKNTNQSYTSETDPGVVSVKEIFYYYKKYNHKTIIMGASFRNIGEIEELAGIDYLTISPALLKELASSSKYIEPKLTSDIASKMTIPKLCINEQNFRYLLNDNQMATEKLSEGIRNFAKDGNTLMKLIEDKIASWNDSA